MRGWLKNLFVFGAVLCFFALTVPANHSEAEDAYAYAYLVEQGTVPELFQMHHLLYLPFARGVFFAVHKAGIAARALPVLIAISMVSGALGVCFFAVILRRLGLGRLLTCAFSGALLFSYGFWRYSTTAEIYIPVAALCLMMFCCAIRAEERRLFFWVGVLAGSAALLLHLITLPAVLLAVPLFYFLQGQRRRAAVHVTAAVLIAGGVYAAVAACGIRPGVFTDTLVARGGPAEPLTWLKALIAWGQTVLSGNFLFSIPAAADRLIRLFPSQMLQEELFAGKQASLWRSWAAPVTFGLVAALAAWGFYILARNLRKMRVERLPAPVAVLVWLVGTAGMAFLFEPANPEMWISVLPALWLLTALLWSALPDRLLFRKLPVFLAAFLLLHNWVGGMAVVKQPEGDYCRQKAAWVIGESKAGDLVVTADSYSFITFLQYQILGRVLDAKFISAEEFATAVRESSGRIFVLKDVIQPLPPINFRPVEAVSRLHELAASLRPELVLQHEGPIGSVYQWVAP